MANNSKESDSSKASWAAHREAERLTDRSIAAELGTQLHAERQKPRRRACLFIIGKIGANLSDHTCAEIMLSAITKERDKYVLSSTLDLLAGIPMPAWLDLSLVYDHLADPRWLVRHAAIRALEGSAAPESEERLLAHLSATTDPDDQIYCHSTLNRIGTPRAVPSLQRGTSSRKRDVRMSAESAIEAIQKRMKMIAQPAAAPNGCPATPLDNSGAGKGPPSLS